MNMPRPEGSYNYPVYPGMKKWESLLTEEDKINACQIPFSVLETMPTDALIQAIWEYPFFTEIGERDGSYQSDFEKIISSTNVFIELISRVDVGVFLLKRYANLQRLSDEDPLVKAFEILFSQSDLLYQLCYPDRINTMKLILEEKNTNNISTLFLMGRIMQGVYYLPFVNDLERNQPLINFLETSSVNSINDHSINTIVSNAEAFVNYKNENFQELIKDKNACMNMLRPEDSFDYYIYPGMIEWSVFTAGIQMVTTSQIPEDLLKNMSTQAVIQAIWEYPFFMELYILLDGNYDRAFQTISFTNAYKELITRDDAGYALLERYRLMDVVGVDILQPKYFELLFCQHHFLSQLSLQEKKEIVKLAFEKEIIRQENGIISVTSEVCWFLIGRTMQNAQYAPFMKEIEERENLRVFLETSYIDRRESEWEQSNLMLTLIIEYGNQFLN